MQKKTFVYYVDTQNSLGDSEKYLSKAKAKMLDQLKEQYEEEFINKELGLIVIERPGQFEELKLREVYTISNF